MPYLGTTTITVELTGCCCGCNQLLNFALNCRQRNVLILSGGKKELFRNTLSTMANITIVISSLCEQGVLNWYGKGSPL